MTVCDFARSYATFVTPNRANNARIQVEAICDLLSGAQSTRYVLLASCKAEDTYADDDLFQAPNYDFSVIFSATQYQIIRVGLPLGPDWLETGISAERFEEVRIDVAQAPARVCESEEAIVQATLADLPLVGRTELLDDAGRVVARLEYPIKTMNVNDRRWAFQVDTGPVIVPDFSRQAEQEIELFEVAFVAFSRFDRAEFIVQRPTPVGGERGALVGHYSHIRKLPVRNEVMCVGGSA